MSNEEQVPVVESNPSAASGESSKVNGSADVEQPHKENGSTESGKASGSNDAEHPREEGAPAQAPKYGIDIDSSRLTSIVGDNPRVTINYYVEIIQGKRIKPSEGDDGTSNKIPDSTDELISKNLNLERQGTTFFTGSESKDETTKLHETEEEFSQWYYGLGEYEQYYVQTAAILHGAPAHEVSKRADSLYKLIREELEKRESSIRPGLQQGDQRESPQRDASRFADPLLRRVPSRELRINTHTITRRVSNVERLYWRDVDQYGLSTFGLRLLDFLSKEFISKGEHGQISLDVLKQWSEESDKEVSWKAAHSYGVVLWCHNADLLSTEAKDWAKVNSFRSRRRTAELLDGAYEIENVKGDGDVRSKRTSSVVSQLLDDWIDRVHTEFSAANANLGVAVASTYGLIGKRSPEIALAGLERLLQLPQSRSTEETRSIFAAGVSTYVTLTWSGHVRNVLDHLASNTEQLSHQHSLPQRTNERQRYRRQREVRLNATLETFFLVAASSLTEVQDSHVASYRLTGLLPQHPVIPDPQRRDVLLAGLLLANDVRENITTLLCAAIVEKKSKPAFELLRHWAEVVLKMRAAQDTAAEEIYASFRQFIVNLGKTVDKWCLDLENLGLRSPQAIDTFKNRLKQWCIEGHYRSDPIGSLAQEVLNQLSG